jgi:hypothetical protein
MWPLVSHQSELQMRRSAAQTQNSLAYSSPYIFFSNFFLLLFFSSSFSTLSKDSARQHLLYSGILSVVPIRLSIADPCDIEVRRVGFFFIIGSIRAGCVFFTVAQAVSDESYINNLLKLKVMNRGSNRGIEHYTVYLR